MFGNISTFIKLKKILSTSMQNTDITDVKLFDK